MAAAAAEQPTRNPKSSCSDRFSRPSSLVIKGRPDDTVSIRDRTAFVKLPVITAVEIAPGKAKRKMAY